MVSPKWSTSDQALWADEVVRRLGTLENRFAYHLELLDTRFEELERETTDKQIFQRVVRLEGHLKAYEERLKSLESHRSSPSLQSSDVDRAKELLVEAVRLLGVER